MVRSLLALDLALATGVAAWREGDPKPYVSRLDIPHSEDIGPRLASLYRWGLRFTKEREITDIAVETPITSQMPGTALKAMWLISAYGVITMLGAQCKINVVPIANVTMAIHWMGSRDIEKAHRKTYSVLEAQRRGFPNITDHNTADALGILSLRCSQLGLIPPWDYKRSPGPLFTGIKHPQGTTITKANQRAATLITNKALSFERSK